MNTTESSVATALASGLIGAVTLNIVHETVRQFIPAAPRVDLVGMRAIANGLRAARMPVPSRKPLHRVTLAGDLLANGLYYSLVGLARPTHTVAVGAALGVLAGVGAVTLPGPLGLGNGPTNRSAATVAMTIGWYTVGGLVAAGAFRLFKKES